MEQEKPRGIKETNEITKKEAPHAPHYLLSNDEKGVYLDSIRKNGELSSILKTVLQRWQEKNPEKMLNKRNDTEDQFHALGKNVMESRFQIRFTQRHDLLEMKKNMKQGELSKDEQMELAELKQWQEGTANGEIVSSLMERYGMNVRDLQLMVFDAAFALREDQGGPNAEERKTVDSGLRFIEDDIHTTTHDRVKWETFKKEALKAGDIVISGPDAAVIRLQPNGTYLAKNTGKNYKLHELCDQAPLVELTGNVIHMVTPYDMEQLKK